MPLKIIITLGIILFTTTVATAASQKINDGKPSCSNSGASHYFKVNDDIRGYVSVNGSTDSTTIYFFFSLRGKSSLKLIRPELILENNNLPGPIVSDLPVFWRVVSEQEKSPTERIKYFKPNDILKGPGPRATFSYDFQSIVNIRGFYAQSFRLLFPVLETNGQKIKVAPIEFEYKNQSYQLKCPT